MKTSKWIPAALIISLFAASAWAAPYVVLKDGRRMEGTAIRALPNGDINLTTQMGIQTIPAAQVAQAVADKPAEFAQAEAAVKAKRYDEAVKLLNTVITRYRHLNWEVEGVRLLAQAQYEGGDSAAAVQSYDKLFQLDPNEKTVGTTVWNQRRAMLSAGQYQALIRQLDAVAASGSRADAARAQTMRGDILLAQNNLDGAVLDYLRTAVMFTDVRDADVMGEATFKAAQTLEQLRHPHAKEMYRKVVSDYGQSSYAAQARQKL